MVDWADAVQPVTLFEIACCCLGLETFVPGPDGIAVLANQRRHDVDVIVGVADRDPPDGVWIAMRRDADGGDHLGRDVRPLGVRQGAVGDVVADGRMPDGLLRGVFPCADRLFE
ncbi:hypothetical protein WEI85_07820 [Actinomycetes bacterium KLBMP 9797]